MEKPELWPEGFRANKKLGQHFLIDESVAELEASYCKGRRVIELGPGLGMLTRRLCESAREVVAVEKDHRLYSELASSISFPNLTLLNADFFSLGSKELEGWDMLASNVPYMLSSKVIDWLLERKIEALLCLQKEFVERMLATVGSRNYSRLSVMSALLLDVERIAEVPAEKFFPKPRVDSEIIHVKPLDRQVSAEEARIIKLLMEHKKKRLRNSIIDSSKALGLSKESARNIAGNVENSGERVFRLPPQELLFLASALAKKLNLQKE
ncbi:MAG: 16S rRNA (adenine(1518)-N(6)/adenine(1519)-N(6))-dimethyltransferase RsmA [Candidatus Micrarchaeaceae archaeon]